jgi:hypothetical protein
MDSNFPGSPYLRNDIGTSYIPFVKQKVAIIFRTYNPNQGNLDVGFRPHLNGHHSTAILVGWVEGRNPTSGETVSTQPTTTIGKHQECDMETMYRVFIAI